jgi:hypothetical protein
MYVIYIYLWIKRSLKLSRFIWGFYCRCQCSSFADICQLCLETGHVYRASVVTALTSETWLFQASKEAVLHQIGEAECIHLATHMSWKLSAIVLSPGGDIVESQHPKRFFSSAASTSGVVVGQTATANGIPAASDQVHDQGDEEGSEVRVCDTPCFSVWMSPGLLSWTENFHFR